MTSKDFRYPASTADVAFLLGVTSSTLIRWIPKHDLKVKRTLGGVYRWPRVTVENLERRMEA